MIYLDNAATTRPDGEALKRANIYLNEKFYNPSALYGGGVMIKNELTKARESLLSYVADPFKTELIFTSGGTEADNLALFSLARRGNFVTSAGEHAAIYQSAMELKNRGVEVRFAPLNGDGSVNVDALLSLVDDKTCLVSIVHVNNETGAINDVNAIARLVKAKSPRAKFHSDGVQAFGKIRYTLSGDIDLYSVSAHKIGGVKGTGALIKKRGIPLPALIFGGGQESGYRSGTENIFGIMAFAAAAEYKFKTLDSDYIRLKALKEELFLRFDGELFERIGNSEGSPYILTVAAKSLRGEILQRMAEDRGVIVGTGSACSSKHPFSRVIQSCGVKENLLHGVLRLSFSTQTGDEAKEAVDILNSAAKQLKEKIG